MSHSKLIQLSGVALLLAAPLGILGDLLHPAGHELADQTSPTWVPAHLFILSAMALALIGLPGLYARQAERAGLVGLIGFSLTSVGMATVGIGFMMFEAFAVPVLVASPANQRLVAESGPILTGPLGLFLGINGLALQAGLFLLGIATMRAGVLPRWPGLLLVGGVIVALAAAVVPPLARFVGMLFWWPALAWLGFALSSHPQGQTVSTPSPKGPAVLSHTFQD